MKKWYFCLICLFCTASITQGQYYRQDNGFLLGVNAGYSYPLGDMGKILKNGLGGNVAGKYLINHVIGIGFEAGYHSFKSKVLLSNDNTDQDSGIIGCFILYAELGSYHTPLPRYPFRSLSHQYQGFPPFRHLRYPDPFQETIHCFAGCRPKCRFPFRTIGASVLRFQNKSRLCA